MGVAALVIGIVALTFSIIPLLGALAIYLAIPGGLLGIGQIVWPKKKKGLAIAGLILCLIAGGVSFAQYKAVEAVGEKMAETTKQFEAETGVVINDAPAQSKKTQSKVEPLKLANLYSFKNREAQIKVLELENLTGKTITVFKGYVLELDDFGKIAKRSQVQYKVTIGPKSKIVVAEVGDGRQSQLMTAESIQALGKQLPLPFNDIKYPNEAKFECTDIKYAE